MSEEQQIENWKDHLSKETQEVSASFELKKEVHDWVELERGLNGDGDYVWHFSTHHNQRIFPQNMKRVREIIVTFLSKSIPEEIKVDYYPSPDDWEKKVETVKANGIGKLWNYDEDLLNRHLPKILELLNKEIVYYAERKRRTGL